jgi:hypothetical protein
MQVHESLQHDTVDQQDHSFSGIMFDISSNESLPVDLLQLESVWVRGGLGPMSVYVTKEPGSFFKCYSDTDSWKRVYVPVALSLEAVLAREI